MILIDLKELYGETAKLEHLPQYVEKAKEMAGEGNEVVLTGQGTVADYTGGTASMTAGMVLACSTSEDRDAQYMKAKEVTPTGIAAPAAEATPILVDLRFGARH